MVDSSDNIYNTEICTPETLKSPTEVTSPDRTQFEACFQWDGTTLSEEDLYNIEGLIVGIPKPI